MSKIWVKNVQGDVKNLEIKAFRNLSRVYEEGIRRFLKVASNYKVPFSKLLKIDIVLIP